LPPPPPKPRTPPTKRPGPTPVPVPTEPGPVDVPPPSTNTPPPAPPGPIDPPLPTAGSVGLCVRANQQYAETLKSAQSVFSGISSAVASLDAANQSNAADRQTVLADFAPRYDAFVEQFYKLSEETRTQSEQFQLCTDTLPEWV